MNVDEGGRQKFEKLRLLKQKKKQLNKNDLAKDRTSIAKKNAEALERSVENERPKAHNRKEDASQRVSNLNYSIDEIEKWEEKTAASHEEFQDFEKLAASAYEKQSFKMAVDEEAYNKHMENRHDGMEYTRSLSKAKVEGIAKEYKIMKNKKAQKLGKRNKNNKTSGFISEKNKQFNEKLDRHYAEHTKEIKESFERGTAL